MSLSLVVFSYCWGRIGFATRPLRLFVNNNPCAVHGVHGVRGVRKVQVLVVCSAGTAIFFPQSSMQKNKSSLVLLPLPMLLILCSDEDEGMQVGT